MEKEVQKFLQAEETAEKLLQTLKQLHAETTSYQTATKELETVRQRLIGLIESIERVANGSHEAIKILKEIGGPEILSRLTMMENGLTKESLKVLKGVEELKAKTSEKITMMEYKVSSEAVKQLESLKKLKTLIMATLASSIIASIIGIIALLR